MDGSKQTITNLIDELDGMVEDARSAMFARNQIMLDRGTLEDLIADMRANLPAEIKQAKDIVNNCNRKLKEASNQAQIIVEKANTEAQQLTMEHEITKLAQAEAERIIAEANEEAKKLRIGATEYIKDIFARAETVLNESLNAYTSQSVEVQNFLSGEVNIILKVRQDLMGGRSDEGYGDENYDDYDEQ